MATLSCHNGTSMSYLHNIRDKETCIKQEHIDLSRPHFLWINKPIKDAYEEFFGEAVREYNDKQKRKDRRINDYYKKVEADKQKNVVYEMICGVYDAQETPEETKRAILKEFVDDWEKENPTLKIIGAYYHADELGKEPHVHIDYVPVASGFKRGMSVQNSLSKALYQMGYLRNTHKNTPQMQFCEAQRQRLEKIANKYGISIERLNEKRAHLDTATYKMAMDLAKKDLFQAKKQMSEEYGQYIEVLDKLQEVDKELIPTVNRNPITKKETVSKEDYNKLEKSHKKAINVIKSLVLLVKAIFERFERILALKDKEIEYMRKTVEEYQKTPSRYKIVKFENENKQLMQENTRLIKKTNNLEQSNQSYKTDLYTAKNQAKQFKIERDSARHKVVELDNQVDIMMRSMVSNEDYQTLLEQYQESTKALNNLEEYLKTEGIEQSEVENIKNGVGQDYAYNDYDMEL